jgi:hypothetical protein
MDGYAAAFGLGGGVGMWVGIWAALWWRERVPKGQRWLVRRIYIHVDEVLGATKTENLRRASRRFKVQRWLGRGTTKKGRKRLGTAIADFFWAMPQIGTGTAALPSVRRMGHYVQLELAPSTPKKLAQRHHVQRVWLRWTSEAAANGANFVEWLERGRPLQGGGLAQALGLEWKGGMFDHTFYRDHDQIRFDRTRPAAVPDELPAHEELDA